MTKVKTPIVVIIFNRPNQARDLREALRNQEERALYVVSDGPRADHPAEAALVEECRRYFNDWQGEAHLCYASSNMGCKARISSGLDWVFEQTERAIILEEDCCPHPDFFPFCDSRLEHYADSTEVLSICGTKTFAGEAPEGSNQYFSRYNNCWGWATWRRAWALYDDQFFAYSSRQIICQFRKFLGSYRAAIYWHYLLCSVLNGKINSWAYCWMMSGFLRQGLHLYPAANLVVNSGFGRDATHTATLSPFMPQTYGELGPDELPCPESITPFDLADHWIEDNMYSKSLRVRFQWLCKKFIDQNEDGGDMPEDVPPIHFSNIRPGRSSQATRLRAIANRLRSYLYFKIKAPWVVVNGMVRIPWCVDLWSPNRDISLGDKVQFGPGSIVHCDATFGSKILIARNVSFVGRDDHKTDVVGLAIWDSPRGDSGKTLLEDDIWVGHGAIILAGVRIGRGSIIAAGSLVKDDVPRYGIVAGVPAQVVAMRFNDGDIRCHEAVLYPTESSV